MQIDKHHYNIEALSDMTQRAKYIAQLSQQSLNEVQKQIIERVNKCNPDDPQIIDQIRTAFSLYIQLMSNKTFNVIPINDESFISSVGFYLQAEKQTDAVANGILFVQHQYCQLGQKVYAQSINLFKALLQIYESASQQHYERITLLILQMVVQNVELLTAINHKYYFLECLIQIVNKCKEFDNKEKNVQKLCEYFSQLRKLYSSENALLFHSIDFQILVDILLRTLINQNKSIFLLDKGQIIEQTLQLYLIVSQNPIISKDRYRVEEFHEAIKEKFNYINKETLNKNLKNLIQESLEFK